MANLAGHLSEFLRKFLPCERRASQHTCETYAYTFQLLVTFAAKRLNRPPSKLSIEQLNVDLIVNFLNYLESSRGNTTRTRNARAAAIKTFFRYLEYRDVSCMEQSRRIQAIPQKKTDDRLVAHLSLSEMQAIVDAPNLYTRSGIRARAMIHLCFAAGLRVSELVGHQTKRVDLSSKPKIHVIGKGRRERVLPLWDESKAALNAWLSVRPKTIAVPELFLNSQGRAMTRSGFEYILSKHVSTDSIKKTSLLKKRVTPHVLRHYIPFLTMSCKAARA